MKTKMIVIISTVLLIGLALAGVANAQSIPAFRYAMLNDLDGPNSDVDEDLQAVCSGDVIHPGLESLAQAYDVEYEKLLEYFCDYEFGLGEIEHALVTAELEGVDYTYEELLEWRYNEGMKDVGWGEIWQDLGLIGMGMDELEEDFGENTVCTGDMVHPVLDQLAERFEVEYSDLMFYFCEQHFGIGEIKLALETAQFEAVEMSYDQILGERFNGEQKDVGWGQIWHDLGLIGRGKQEKGESFAPDENNQPQEQNENWGGNNKPEVPSGLSGGHPGKGRGPKK